MAKMNVDIPDKLLDTTSKERIKELERKLKNAENREEKLKKKLREGESKIRTANQVLQSLNVVLEEIRWMDGFEELRYGYEC